MTKSYTVTYTANIHIDAESDTEALKVARVTLPSSFDVIDEEIKLSEDEDTE